MRWLQGCGAWDRSLAPSLASPGDTPLGLYALDPRVIYVLELQAVIHTGSVHAHRNRNWAQSIG